MNLLSEIYQEYNNLKKKHLKKKLIQDMHETYSNVIRFGKIVPNDNDLFPVLYKHLLEYAKMLNVPSDKITVYRNYIPKLSIDKEVYLSAIGRYIGGDVIFNFDYYDMQIFDALHLKMKEKDKVELENFVGTIFIIIFSKQ